MNISAVDTLTSYSEIIGEGDIEYSFHRPLQQAISDPQIGHYAWGERFDIDVLPVAAPIEERPLALGAWAGQVSAQRNGKDIRGLIVPHLPPLDELPGKKSARERPLNRRLNL